MLVSTVRLYLSTSYGKTHITLSSASKCKPPMNFFFLPAARRQALQPYFCRQHKTQELVGYCATACSTLPPYLGIQIPSIKLSISSVKQTRDLP